MENGLTVKFETIDEINELVAVKAGTSPTPVIDANPILILECCHSYTVPGIKDPPKLMGPTVELAHLIILPTVLTCGVERTSRLNVTGVPLQPFNLGVTLNIPTIGTALKLFTVSELICPLPAAGIPIEVLELVQLKLVPE